MSTGGFAMSDSILLGHDPSDYLVPQSGIERFVAAACHGALVVGMPFILPFCVWLGTFVLPTTHYVRNQAMQALLFHAFFLLVSTGAIFGFHAAGFAAILGFFGVVFHPLLLAWPIALALAVGCSLLLLWCVMVMFIATLRALQGQPYRVPVVGNMVH